MKYSDYKESVSALREIIATPEMSFSRQFAKTTIRGRRGSVRITAIWNCRANNVTAIINTKGNIFLRENSIYTTQLLASEKRKYVKHANLQRYRRYIDSYIREQSTLSYLTGKSMTKLIQNNDQTRRVFLIEIAHNRHFSVDMLFRELAQRLRDRDMPNTLYSLRSSAYHLETIAGRDANRLYIDISEAPATIEEELGVDPEMMQRLVYDRARSRRAGYSLHHFARATAATGEYVSLPNITYSEYVDYASACEEARVVRDAPEPTDEPVSAPVEWSAHTVGYGGTEPTPNSESLDVSLEGIDI